MGTLLHLIGPRGAAMTTAETLILNGLHAARIPHCRFSVADEDDVVHNDAARRSAGRDGYALVVVTERGERHADLQPGDIVLTLDPSCADACTPATAPSASGD